MNERPNIFAYNDFRKFLNDFYDFNHGIEPDFTKAFICKELGLPNSRSYFQDVLNGKFVSEVKVPLFIKLLGLSHDEAQYFRVLVRFNQSDDPEEKELLLDQLISLNRTPQKIVSPKAYSYYKQWYHSVVKAILEVIDFTGDYAGLGRALLPPITVRQARASIKLLLDLGLIKKNETGVFKPTDKVVSTGAFAQDAIIRQFQLKCIESARFALTKNQKQPERVLTNTISISEEGYKRLEKHLQKFCSEVRSIIHKDETKPDRVYQLDILLFPQMRKVTL
jgi:uncharacterized protein (TIGR02147 family)